MILGRAARILLDGRRALRAFVPGLLVALPPLFWVVDATERASLTSLGRDQGIFQYVAWAWANGERGYSETRDVNGPLTPLVHMIFIALGGRDEHQFRILDLLVSGLVFALVGLCLPGFARSTRANEWKTSRAMFERVGWAAAAWVVFSGQYLLYIFWDTAQRESFFDWFLLSSVAIQLVAQRRLAERGADRKTLALLAIAGGLSVTMWFGKPTYGLFTLFQLVTLAVDRLDLSRKRRFATFAAGGAVGFVIQLAVLLRYADLRSFLRITLTDVPAMYRFIWPRSAVEIFSLEGYAHTVVLAIVTSVVFLGLLSQRLLPRRALTIGLLPLGGLVNVVAQGKGFPYHFHPVTSGVAFQWLALCVWAWERPRGEKFQVASRLVPVLASAALAIKVALAMPQSPYIQSLFLFAKARDSEERSSRDYLVYFQTPDYFPWQLRQVATYLRAHTREDDRVQIYGMDPYVLFLAERKSASPYIYAYDLNVDAALAGGILPEPRGLHPNPIQKEKIRAIREEHEEDLLTRLQKAPPAAFVFLDKSPLITWQESERDFELHCPKTSAWVQANYKKRATFSPPVLVQTAGGFHVWLRNDRAEGVAVTRDPDPNAPVQPEHADTDQPE